MSGSIHPTGDPVSRGTELISVQSVCGLTVNVWTHVFADKIDRSGLFIKYTKFDGVGTI